MNEKCGEEGTFFCRFEFEIFFYLPFMSTIIFFQIWSVSQQSTKFLSCSIYSNNNEVVRNGKLNAERNEKTREENCSCDNNNINGQINTKKKKNGVIDNRVPCVKLGFLS